MSKTLLIGLLFFSLRSVSQIPAPQTTLNMGGGSGKVTPAFIVDWSIGESTVIETYFGENSFANSIVGVNWNLTSGILQPFKKSHPNYNFLIPSWTNQEIRFYPVPTPGIVFIDFRSLTTGKITIQLYTSDFRILGLKEFDQINGNSTQSWNLSNQPSGVYYFRILLSSAKGEILKQGTFKIEKVK